MITRRIVINVITFFVLAAVLIFYLIVSIFRVQRHYVVTGTFAESGGVFTGQEVTYRGVTVGRVGDLRVVPSGVEIELVIESRYDTIPEDAEARVMFKSAVGEQFVDLLPRTDTGPFFTDGDRIPIEDTRLPVQQEELLRLLNAVLEGIPPQAIGRLVDTVGTGLGGRGEQLHVALAALDPITAVLARRTEELNRIAENADHAGSAFARSASDFVRGAENLAIVSQSLAKGAPDLGRVLEEGSVTAPELASLVAARKGELNQVIADLAQVTRITHARIASVDATLRWLPVFLSTLVNSFDVQNRYFRFALLTNLPLVPAPCSYGTPRRPPTATGDGPGQPYDHDFARPCVASGQAPAAARGALGPSGSTARRGADVPEPPDAGLLDAAGRWLNLVTDTLAG